MGGKRDESKTGQDQPQTRWGQSQRWPCSLWGASNTKGLGLHGGKLEGFMGLSFGPHHTGCWVLWTLRAGFSPTEPAGMRVWASGIAS